MTACPLTGHANSPAFSIGRHQFFGGIRCRACVHTPGFFHILGVDTDNGAYLIAISRNKSVAQGSRTSAYSNPCLLYTSDAADDLLCVDLGGRRIIKKKKKIKKLTK